MGSTNITCSLIGINVYPKEAITFSIIVNGSLYDYISPLNVVHSFKNSESFVKPPTDEPVKVLPPYSCEKVTMEELIEATKDNYPKKKSFFDKIFH